MPDQLSALYSEFLEGGYDCVDRVILNAYFSMGQSGGGFRMWWRELYGSDENLDDNHLMRMAGRFSRRLRAWAKANSVPVVYCAAGERKHEIAEEHLSTKQVKPRVYQTRELLHDRERRRRVGEGRRHLVSERDCRALTPTLRALDL
jgi:hypothetical protein